MTEKEILDLLHRRYSQVNPGNGPRWVCAEHVRNGPGFDANRTLDFVALDTWSKYELHGHEIKCSRSDWLRELKDPTKAGAFLPDLDRFWLVVSDSSVVKTGELPGDWGLMIVAGLSLRAKVPAPLLTEPCSTYDRKQVTVPRKLLVPLMRATQDTARRYGRRSEG